MTESANAIVVEHLTKVVKVGFFGTKKTLLTDVSLHIPAGSTVGFVGANGAGKSTTLKHVIGASAPTQGSVRVFGADPRKHATRRRLGYMPELPLLPPTLTLRELLHLHGTLCGVADRAKRADELAELVGLHEHAKARVGTFSKGMQTRAGLALALLHDPELLVLDEPMSGLDPVGRELVRGVLMDARGQGKTILFSSHVLSDVEALCDRIAVIAKGKIVFEGASSDAMGAIGGWTVRVHAPSAPAVEGATIKREGDTWLVQVAGGDGLALAQQLRSAGCTVLALEPRRARLEDRVLAWMEGSTA